MVVYFALSVVDNALSRMTRVDVKLLLDQRRDIAHRFVLSQISRGKFRVVIPLHVMTHFTMLLMTLCLFDLLRGAVGSSTWAGLATLVSMGGIVLVFHHILPWAISPGDPIPALLRLMGAVTPVVLVGYALCLPIINLAARRQIGATADLDDDGEISDEEVQAYLDVGAEEGIFEREESRIIQQVVEFRDTIVREVMTPRTEMVAIRDSSTLDDLKNLMVQSRHSRIPVYRETVDSITGVVYVRNLLAQPSMDSVISGAGELVMPAFFVPETKRVPELLREMQNRGEHLAVVVDEYGGTAGVVSLEDLIEEIVGEIRDEDQPAETEIAKEPDGSLVMRGDTEISDVEDLLNVDLYDEAYNTVAGMVIKHLGRFPRKDEVVNVRGVEVRVLEMDSRKIRRLRICAGPGGQP